MFELGGTISFEFQVIGPVNVGESHTCGLRRKLITPSYGVAAAHSPKRFIDYFVVGFLPAIICKLPHQRSPFSVNVRECTQGAQNGELDCADFSGGTSTGHG